MQRNIYLLFCIIILLIANYSLAGMRNVDIFVRADYCLRADKSCIVVDGNRNLRYARQVEVESMTMVDLTYCFCRFFYLRQQCAHFNESMAK